MDAQSALDLAREALWQTLLIGAPLLAAALVLGLVIGLLQAMTQVQDQTVAFVPKLVGMLIALSVAMPWLISQMTQYAHDLIAGIPGRL